MENGNHERTILLFSNCYNLDYMRLPVQRYMSDSNKLMFIFQYFLDKMMRIRKKESNWISEFHKYMTDYTLYIWNIRIKCPQFVSCLIKTRFLRKKTELFKTWLRRSLALFLNVVIAKLTRGSLTISLINDIQTTRLGWN